MDHNSTTAIIDMLEKERQISNLRQLNHDLMCNIEKETTKLRDEAKLHLERVRFPS